MILGNCEYALEEMVDNPKYANQIVHYLNRIGKGRNDSTSSRKIEYRHKKRKS